MSSAATARITNRLKEGDWYLHRTGKHQIWKHPNGATYPLSTTMSEGSRGLRNAFAQIARLERMGPGRPVPGHAYVEVAPPTATAVDEALLPPPTPLDDYVFEPRTGGEWVSLQRTEAGLSIADVADLVSPAYPHITPDVLADVERDTHALSCEELDAIFQVLDAVPPEDLQFYLRLPNGGTRTKTYWDACDYAIPVATITLKLPVEIPPTAPIAEEPTMPVLPQLSAVRTDALSLLMKAASSSMVSDEDVAEALQAAREALKAKALANVAKDFE